MFAFSLPTTALFGAGKLNELHSQINAPMGAVHGRKALVVISNGKSVRANGYLGPPGKRIEAGRRGLCDF